MDELEDVIDGVELTIDESDVEVKKPKRRVRDVVAKIFVADEQEEPKRGRPKGTKASKFFVSKAPFILSGLASVVVLLPGLDTTFEINGETKQLAPTYAHLDGMVTPLLRIADRHAKISELNPDAADITDTLIAVIVYAIELRTNIMLYHLVEAQKKEAEKDVQAQNNFPFKHSYLDYEPPNLSDHED